MKILVSNSATTLQLQKAKEVEKKGQKKIEQLTKALKELKAGVKAAKAVNKKGDGTSTQLKTIVAAHKHIKVKTKASSSRPSSKVSTLITKKPIRSPGYKINPRKKVTSTSKDSFVVISDRPDTFHKTLDSAQKVKPKTSSGSGYIYTLVDGKKDKEVMVWSNTNPITKTKTRGHKWFFTKKSMFKKYSK